MTEEKLNRLEELIGAEELTEDEIKELENLEEEAYGV